MTGSLDGMGLQPESNHSIFFLHISRHGAVARLGADPRKIAQIRGVEVRHSFFLICEQREKVGVHRYSIFSSYVT